MRDIASPLDGFASPFGVPVRFYPANVFGDGSNGLLWDFSATTGLYSDNLGATPLTAPDTGVGLVADRSRVRSPVTAYGGAQASAGFRPKWGRAPVSRRNLLLIGGTAMLNNSDGSALIDNAPTGFTPPVDASFQRITKNTSATQFYCYRTSQPGSASVQSVFSYHVLPDAGCTEIGFHTDTNAQGRMRYNLSTGVVTKGVNTADAGAVALGGGWYRIWSKTAGVSASNVWNIVGNTAAVGDAASFVVGCHQSEASVLTALQKTVNAYDMTEAGVPSYGYIRPDRTDDVLSTVLTLAQTGDVAVFGTSGSWLETARAYTAGSTFSIGPTTVTGLTSGLLAALGDIVGIVAIGRTLTDAELASTLAYFKARGAAGWLTAGAELVTNGTFDANVSGWTNLTPTGSSFAWNAGGYMDLVNSTGLPTISTSFPTVAGTPYLVTAAKRGTASVINIGSSAGGVNLFNQANDSVDLRAMFIATTATSYLSVARISAGTSSVDNVSVKPLTVAP